MITSKRPHIPLFVFSKWSRKSYAVFASLNRIINVAQLSINITQIAGNKQLSPIKYLENDILEDNDIDITGAAQHNSEFNINYILVNSDILYTDINRINNNPKPKVNFVWTLGLLMHS